jgi:DNA-binding SARP family transcriptional activator/Tfp pilus assembly protein PilF
MHMQPSPAFFIHLFGTFTVRRKESKMPVGLRRKTRAVLAYLAATDQAHPRQALVDMFCQEVNDPRGAFRSILSRIRQHLGPEVLVTEGNKVRLNRALSWVDCLQFAQVLEGELDARTLEALDAALNLYQGEFLEATALDDSPEFELWLLNERRRYQRLYEQGLARLAVHHIAQGEIEDAIIRTHALIQSNPLLEEAHARLMWLYASSGQPEAALAQFEQCRKILQRELAVEPTPELLALREEIAAAPGERFQGRPSPPDSASVELFVTPKQAATIHLPWHVGHSAFVGRAGEMAQLQQAWANARPAQTQVVLLAAEAGMGKTRLVHEFVQNRVHVDFLAGECYESMHTVAFSPWLDVLASRLDQLDDADLQHLSTFALDYLTRLMPALARRLHHARLSPLPSSSGELMRLFTAVGEFLLELPGARPLILFIDNLQWADEASLQLFHFLARRAPPGKFLLLGAYRSDEAINSPALQSLLNDLSHQSVVHVQLAPLTALAIMELMAQGWSSLPADQHPRVSTMLGQATGGNPLFVSEILRELAGATQFPSVLPVPGSVRELILRRLQQFPDSARQVLEALAVLGAAATPSQAQQTSARSEEEVYAAMDLALRRGLLAAADSEDARPGPVRYDFCHDLMREVVSGQLSHIRRQLLHRRAALTLEQAGAAAATLAHHWRMAGDVENEGRFAALAGEQAASLYANEETLRYLARALELCSEPLAQIPLYRKLGEVKQLTGRWAEAEDAYQRAIELAVEHDDRHALAACQAMLGRLLLQRGQYAKARQMLDRAEVAFQAQNDLVGLSSVAGDLGLVHWYQGEYPQALARLEQRLALARQAGDRRSAGIAIANMGIVYYSQGDYAKALDCYEEKLSIDREFGDRLSISRAAGNIGLVYRDLGDYQRALEGYIEKWQIDSELGDRLGVGIALENIGDIYTRQGDFEQALLCLQQSLEIAVHLESRQVICVALGRMIPVFSELGKSAWADRVARQAIRLAQAAKLPRYLCDYQIAHAQALYQRGEYADAQPLAVQALETAKQIEYKHVQFMAQLLILWLHMKLNSMAASTVLYTLAEMQRIWSEDSQQAALYDLAHHLSPSRPENRQRAAELYRTLYTRTPDFEYARRYRALTGNTLPDPPTRLLPTEISQVQPAPLDSLLDQIDQLIGALADEETDGEARL